MGLRWWSDFKEDGTEVWYFESHDEKLHLNPVDSRFFWWSEYIALTYWVVFSLLAILGLKLYWVINQFYSLINVLYNRVQPVPFA